jgi:hypothetical protein
VVVVDNLFTGSHHNLAHHLGKPNFELIRHDVVQPILIEARLSPLAPPRSRAAPARSVEGAGRRRRGWHLSAVPGAAPPSYTAPA